MLFAFTSSSLALIASRTWLSTSAMTFWPSLWSLPPNLLSPCFHTCSSVPLDASAFTSAVVASTGSDGAWLTIESSCWSAARCSADIFCCPFASVAASCMKPVAPVGTVNL